MFGHGDELVQPHSLEYSHKHTHTHTYTTTNCVTNMSYREVKVAYSRKYISLNKEKYTDAKGVI